jgi:DNA-binding MltR family transcriptional regulator
MNDITKDSIYRISQTFRAESDRSASILAASLLDDQLKVLLEKFLVPDKNLTKMFATYAPLSTFSAKFEMAYFLALIPKDIRDDIDCIRKIRNHFAHRIEGIAFDKSPVANLAMNLRSVKCFLANMKFADKPISDSEQKAISESSRRRFEIAVSLVSFALDKYIDSTNPLLAKGDEYQKIADILEKRKKLNDTLSDILQRDAT